MAEAFGGKVEKAAHREFGRASLHIKERQPLFDGIDEKSITVWMSHGDKISKLPNDFKVIAESDNSPYAGICNPTKSFYGVQFHPEVYHTPKGGQILSNFVHKICGCAANWSADAFTEQTIQKIRQQVGNGRVISAVSGGVDSTVMAVLLHRALGKQAVCIFVDNGLLRQDEAPQVLKMLREDLGVQVQFEDASKLFLKNLEGIYDPEQKRKIIGKTFIDVFEAAANKLGGADFLAQGTLYPDLIESVSHVGPSATIKSHHNVGGLPPNMKFKLIEPLKELFKDEVRAVGKTLGVPQPLLDRHPFPGPGLAVRVIDSITEEKLKLLRAADKIFIDELKAENLYSQVWQAFVVLLPVKTVGVMGDARTYDNVVALRAVKSTDGMTADWADLPASFLGKVSTRIANEVRGINRVVYDISSKPPATIEWE
jgi:GMP synthase (glutamine-hydrolysing)